MYRIITLDHSDAGEPEDGFGVDDNGNFFVAISKNGFSKRKEALIFLFTASSEIIVTHGMIDRLSIYKDNYLHLIKSYANDIYDIMVLEKVIEYHILFSGRRKKNNDFYLSKVHINRLITNILSKIYKFVGNYYGGNRINLKKRGYRDFFLEVKNHGFMGKTKRHNQRLCLFTLFFYCNLLNAVIIF